MPASRNLGLFKVTKWFLQFSMWCFWPWWSLQCLR